MGRRVLSLALAVVMAAGAGVALWLYLGSGQDEPVNTPAPVADLTLEPEQARQLAGDVEGVDLDARIAADGDLGPHVRTSPVVLEESRGPLHVQVPSVRIDAPVQVQGIAGTQMTLPSDLSRLGLLSTTAPLAATDEGSTLVAGHVSYQGSNGAMFYLGLTRPGQTVRTWDETGALTEWVITDVRLFRKEALPDEIFQPTGVQRQLNLVTCGGQLYRTSTGYWHHDSNIVVTAVPLEA